MNISSAIYPKLKRIMYWLRSNSVLNKVWPLKPLLKYSHALSRVDVFQVPELNIAFIPTPKVANRSIKSAIAKKLNPAFNGDPHLAGWQYINQRQLAKSDAFRFGFVRNPLDRLYSCYQQKIVLYSQTYNQPVLFWRYGDLFHKDMSFADFVRAVATIPDWYADIHFRSQYTFFYYRGNLQVDFLGKFETLKRDWETLNTKIHIGDIPHLNASPRQDWQSAYTTELVQIAAKRYQKDIQLFGYQQQINGCLDGFLNQKNTL